MKVYKLLVASVVLISSANVFSYARVEVRERPDMRPVITLRDNVPETRVIVRCPSYEFGQFLRVFTDSPHIQRRYTRLPRSINASPDFPLLLNARQRRDAGQIMRYDLLNRHRARVIIEDNNEATAYYFERGACWQLVGAENIR